MMLMAKSMVLLSHILEIKDAMQMTVVCLALWPIVIMVYTNC